jgi:hypothetical protein
VAEAGVKDWGARGGPLIGAWGQGRARGGVHRRACHDGDGGAQWRRRDNSGRGGDGMARLAQKDRGARLQPGRRASNGKTTGQWRPAAIASLAPVTSARKALTGGARLLGKERSRGRGARAYGWGRGVSGGAGARRWATWAAGGRGVRARAREREAAWARSGPAGGGFLFPSFFLFLFLISIFYFYFFYLLFF